LLPSHISERVIIYSDLIKKGKPAASMAVQKRYEKAVIEVIEGLNVKCYIEHLSDEWITVWLFRYSHTIEVIRSLPQAPKTTYDHWVLGKLFGYDEVSISEYLIKHGHIQ